MLGSNFSGLSVLARAPPGTGKSTAAAIALASKSSTTTSGLVLVPTQPLVMQYQSMFEGLGVGTRALYRTGEADLDELQHKKRNKPILIATPQRLLDYLCFDSTLLPLKLNQIVVDELELFQGGNRQTPLEQLLAYLLPKHDATCTFIANTKRKLRFMELEKLLIQQTQKREIVEVIESPPKPTTPITLLRHTGEVLSLESRPFFSGTSSSTHAATIDRVWDHSALVMVPDQVSLGFESEATFVRYNDISGINLNIDNLLVLGWQKGWDLEKLRYAVGEHGGKITICFVGDDNELLRDVYDQLG